MCRVYISGINGQLEDNTWNALGWIGAEQIIKPDSKVFVKPNFTYSTYKPGVTTSPVFLEVLVKALRDLSIHITIGETDGGYYAWKAEEAFKNHKLYEIKKKYDIEIMNLYDSPVEQIQFETGSGEYSIPLPKVLLEDTDVFISAPVLKVHSMTGFTFGLKNQWGCILDPFRMRYHHIFKETVLRINELLAPKLLICDPFYILTDKGPMDGEAVPFNTLIASDNIFAFEQAGCEILGVSVEQIDYLSYAKKLGKIPSSESVCLNVPIKRFCTQRYNLKRTTKDKLVREVFDSAFLTWLLYYSKLGRLIHKLYYLMTGRKQNKLGS